MIFLTPRQCQKLDFDKLNNSALRASFVSVYLVGMGCILDHYEIFATPKFTYLKRALVFSTRFKKNRIFHLFFDHIYNFFSYFFQYEPFISNL